MELSEFFSAKGGLKLSGSRCILSLSKDIGVRMPSVAVDGINPKNMVRYTTRTSHKIPHFRFRIKLLRCREEFPGTSTEYAVLLQNIPRYD
jgi:hypothetical protein